MNFSPTHSLTHSLSPSLYFFIFCTQLQAIRTPFKYCDDESFNLVTPLLRSFVGCFSPSPPLSLLLSLSLSLLTVFVFIFQPLLTTFSYYILSQRRILELLIGVVAVVSNLRGVYVYSIIQASVIYDDDVLYDDEL